MNNTNTNAAQTIEQVIVDEREAHAKFEAETLHKGYRISTLRMAFDSVCPKPNWKTAIDCLVPEAEAEMTKIAIEFFVGGPTTVRHGRFGDAVARLTNRGYYANIGA